jgi:hypothetical protein
MPQKGHTTSGFSRMAKKFTVDIASGCQLWTASLSSQGKYPTIGRQDSRKVDYAHRVAWEHDNGPVPTIACPDGSHRWELHHACFNRSCVNAAHVALVTHREHMNIHTTIRASLKVAPAPAVAA